MATLKTEGMFDADCPVDKVWWVSGMIGVLVSFVSVLSNVFLVQAVLDEEYFSCNDPQLQNAAKRAAVGLQVVNLLHILLGIFLPLFRWVRREPGSWVALALQLASLATVWTLMAVAWTAASKCSRAGSARELSRRLLNTLLRPSWTSLKEASRGLKLGRR